MSDTITGALIGVGGTILGILVGGPITYFFSKRLVNKAHQNTLDTIRITDYNTAAATLRGAFAPAISFLYLGKNHGSIHEPPDENQFLKDALLDQAIAVEKFRHFIPESDRTAYQEAWEKYRHEVWNYEFDSNVCNPDLDAYKVYEDLIHNILLFSKDK